MTHQESEFQRIVRLISQLQTSDGECVQIYNKAIYRTLCKYTHEPDKSIITSMYMPHEIFHAMNLPTIFTEYITGTLSTARKTIPLLQVSEQILQSVGLCSYITSALGIFEQNLLSVPRFFISSSEICEDVPKIFEYLSMKNKARYFHIDVPFSEDNAVIDYVAKQLEEMTNFLEIHTGEKLDNAKLSDAFKMSNQARYYGKMIRELRAQSIPLMHGVTGIQLMGINTLCGSQAAIDVLKNHYETLLERKNNGNTPLKNTQYRVFWVHQYLPYAVNLLSYLETKLQTAIVLEEAFDIVDVELDDNDPFRSLAKKFLSHPIHGTVNNRIANIVNAVDQVQADGVINFSPIGCRLGRCGVPFLKKELDERKIPFLEIIGDSMDYRNYSRAQIETRLDAFVELMKIRKESLNH